MNGFLHDNYGNKSTGRAGCWVLILAGIGFGAWGMTDPATKGAYALALSGSCFLAGGCSYGVAKVPEIVAAAKGVVGGGPDAS